MATRKKKLPELELPGIVTAAVTEYLGARTMNALSSEQRMRIQDAACVCARSVGKALEGDRADLARPGTPS